MAFSKQADGLMGVLAWRLLRASSAAASDGSHPTRLTNVFSLRRSCQHTISHSCACGVWPPSHVVSSLPHVCVCHLQPVLLLTCQRLVSAATNSTCATSQLLGSPAAWPSQGSASCEHRMLLVTKSGECVSASQMPRHNLPPQLSYPPACVAGAGCAGAFGENTRNVQAETLLCA